MKSKKNKINSFKNKTIKINNNSKKNNINSKRIRTYKKQRFKASLKDLLNKLILTIVIHYILF